MKNRSNRETDVRRPTSDEEGPNSTAETLSTSSGLGLSGDWVMPWAVASPSVGAQVVAAAAVVVAVVAAVADKSGLRSCSGNKGCPGHQEPLRCPCLVP